MASMLATLTDSQRDALTKAKAAGRISSDDMHWATRTALAGSTLGYLRMVDRFASGVCVYRITTAGRAALASDAKRLELETAAAR